MSSIFLVRSILFNFMQTGTYLLFIHRLTSVLFLISEKRMGRGSMRKKFTIVCFSLLLFFVVSLTACSESELQSAEANEEKVVRIGYQKNGQLVILKGLGMLEERLGPLGYKVEWKEFQSGPALMEAINAGSIDIGRTGNTPVIFAQAAGSPFVTLAAGKPKYYGSGILVSKNSSIQSVEDLKGKRVSFAKGSSSHYLIVKALEKAGLMYSDITPSFLQPGDARVAFEQGKVDAMVVWDPYTASTELHSDGVLLTNGEGLTTDRDFFIATEKFITAHQDIPEIVIEEVEKSSDWANENHEELIAMLAPILNLDEESLKVAVERRVYGVDDITEEIINEQQDIADMFYDLDIIPEKVDVRKVMEE